jgi:cytoskeletal protein CcmA (bactofilin family)
MIEKQTFTTVGKNALLEGTFRFQGPTYILCELKGDITMLDQATIIFQIGSIVHANVECFDAEIYGDFQGEIRAKGTVTIYPTGQVNGKILAKSLKILPGALVNMNGHTEE